LGGANEEGKKATTKGRVKGSGQSSAPLERYKAELSQEYVKGAVRKVELSSPRNTRPVTFS